MRRARRAGRRRGAGYLRALAAAEPRLTLLELSENGGISRNSNAALEVAEGEFLCLLDHDDILPEHALSAFAALLRERPQTDFIYSDKDMTDASGRARMNPLFKPRWSPETLLTVNYLTHFNALRTSLVREIGGWRPETDGAQDWDIFLRLTERTARVEAVRDVLYRWRMLETSVAGGGLDAKPYAVAAQLRTLEDALRRRGADAAVELDAGTPRPRWNALPERVSAIVLCADDEGAGAAAEAVAARCGARVAEILLPAVPDADAPAAGDGRVRLLAVPPGTGPAARLRAALAAASCELAVVIDAGTLPEPDPRWLDDLLGPLTLPGVAVSAPKVLEAHRDALVRCGIVFDLDGSASDLFAGAPPHAYGLIGSAHWMRNVSAVGGGLFALRTAVGRELGFADAPDYPRADVDFCLRAARAGWRLVYTPFSCAREHAAPALSAPQGDPLRGRMLVAAIWPEGDPNFHPALVSDGPRQLMRLPAQRRGRGYDYAAEAEALTSFYDAAPATIEAARARRPRRPWRSVLWLLPDFAHAYYGGVATILRFAEYLARRHGVRAEFAVTGVTPPDVLAERIGAAFPGLAGAGFHRIASYADAAALPYADAGFATLWTTAYYLLHADVGERCYFVQDNEPQFYPAGSTSALVETTYRFGLRAVCNTATLAEVVRAYGGEAVHFTPAIDPAVFHARGRRARPGPKRLFAYGRPGHARNGFELMARALTRVKAELGDEVDIVTAGAPWSPAAYGLDGVLTNLGLLGYRSTGDLYRTCDAGLVLMMTSHPSYLPMELMACGAVVVTNRNPRTAWLLRDGENALLAETTPSAVAARVVDALRGDERERAALTERASAFVRAQRSDWDGEWDRLVEELWS